MTARLADTGQGNGDKVVTYCLCWRLTRQDGLVMGLSDHDAPVEFDGLVYAPGAALEAGHFTQGLDLRPGRASAAGILTSEAITIDDLRQGVWDVCRIDVYRVNWAQPDLDPAAIWHGYLSEISATRQGKFEAELVSRKSDLERTIGRVYARRCDAQLGDSRCGVDPQGRYCDKRFETCRDVFSNSMRFRGFPHMPGNDFILSGPAQSENDGGRR